MEDGGNVDLTKMMLLFTVLMTVSFVIQRILHERSCFIEFIKRVGEKR